MTEENLITTALFEDNIKPLPKTQVLPNHIKEYLANRIGRTDFIDLFEAESSNVDLRTDLKIEEIILVNIIKMNADYLTNKGIKNNVFETFINQYLRLKISLDRKSRAEFVDINKKERFENNLNKFNTFANLKKVKE